MRNERRVKVRIWLYNILQILSIMLCVWLLGDDFTFDMILIVVVYYFIFYYIAAQILIRRSVEYVCKAHYEAHNMNSPDSNEQSFPNEIWDQMPLSTFGVHTEINKEASYNYYGDLDDIRINYKADHFIYEILGYRCKKDVKNNDSTTVANIHRTLFTIELEQDFFGDEYFFFAHKPKIEDIKYQQDIVKQLAFDPNKSSVLCCNRGYNKDYYNIVYEFIKERPKMFMSGYQTYAIFQGNKIYYLTDNGLEKGRRVPILVTTDIFNQLVDEYIKQIYKFNQVLVDLSRTMYRTESTIEQQNEKINKKKNRKLH
ncbi:hypothetical protein R2F61_03680 [Mollicutes bacterium LVI A0078]|nr:hypothetical protein RZE84_03710 [Mollicutes bacterium LVI A0075]WOO91663.1 hypothetical protein R2F61_03680 [Mollicutes bacterium LVI A0078]